MKAVKPSGTERLTAVAIIRDGRVISRGFKSHWQLRSAIDPGDPDPRTGLPGDVEGFVTSTGRFVDRDEARKVALAAKQVGLMWETAKRPILSSDIDW